MGRRSDHSRDELKALIIDQGHALMGELGFEKFSARAVAKRVGYSVGTIYNVFESHDDLLLNINAKTLSIWQARLERRLEEQAQDRIGALVNGYMDFAAQNSNCWLALYNHRMADDAPVPRWYREKLNGFLDLMLREIERFLPQFDEEERKSLAHSLLANVHGHCVFIQNGTFDLLEQKDPRALLLKQVKDILTRADRCGPIKNQ